MQFLLVMLIIWSLIPQLGHTSACVYDMKELFSSRLDSIKEVDIHRVSSTTDVKHLVQRDLLHTKNLLTSLNSRTYEVSSVKRFLLLEAEALLNKSSVSVKEYFELSYKVALFYSISGVSSSKNAIPRDYLRELDFKSFDNLVRESANFHNHWGLKTEPSTVNIIPSLINNPLKILLPRISRSNPSDSLNAYGRPFWLLRLEMESKNNLPIQRFLDSIEAFRQYSHLSNKQGVNAKQEREFANLYQSFYYKHSPEVSQRLSSMFERIFVTGELSGIYNTKELNTRIQRALNQRTKEDQLRYLNEIIHQMLTSYRLDVERNSIQMSRENISKEVLTRDLARDLEVLEVQLQRVIYSMAGLY